MRMAVLLALAACAAPAAAQLVPGDWEFVYTTTSAALPRAQTSTVRQCLSPAEADDPAGIVSRERPQDCSTKTGEQSENTYTWTVACPKLGMTGSGRASFAGKTLQSEKRIHLVSDGKRMELHTVAKGRHLGPCPTK